MKIFKYSKKTENDIIANVSHALINDELVILPTDTVYGLMALASSNKAIDKLYKAKKRAFDKPTAVLVSSFSQAEKYIGNDVVSNLGKSFWPGPLTIVKGAKKKIRGWNKIGVRIPNDPLVLKILAKIGSPIMASSANISGEEEPKEVSQISNALVARVSITIDKGKTLLNSASTVVEIQGNKIKILRKGLISAEEIEKVISEKWKVES